MTQQPRPVMKDAVIRLRFERLELSWVGEGPRPPELFLGTDNGAVIPWNGEDKMEGKTWPIVDDHAVNGVAFIGDALAVSSPGEMAFLANWRLGAGKTERNVLSCGGHGVLSTAAGYFAAPLGHTGLLFYKPGDEGPTVVRPHGREPNFYALARLDTADGEILLGAARQDGVVRIPMASGVRNLFVGTDNLTNFDAVDVCPLGGPPESVAFAVLGSSGTIVLFKNVHTHEVPITVRFRKVQGTAYRLVSAQGHFFLLTSNGVYVLMTVVERFLAGQDLYRTPTPISHWNIGTPDLSLVHGRIACLPEASMAMLIAPQCLTGEVIPEPLTEPATATPQSDERAEEEGIEFSWDGELRIDSDQAKLVNC